MRSLLLLTILGAGLYAGDEEESKTCRNGTIKGSYGYTLTGTRPVPGGPVGQIEQAVGVGVRHFDGQGNFTQVDTIKGATSGAVVDNPASGTYTINPDCTGVMYLNIPGAPVHPELRLVVVNKGKEIRWIVLSAAPVIVLGHAVRQ